MSPDESASRLRELLTARGLREGQELPASAAADAWDAFKEFARMDVDGMSRDDDSDGLLFQTGVYDWHDGQGPSFNFSLVRQFSFDDEDGEYDHMEQLEALLLFDPTAHFQELPRDELWSFEKSLDQFFAEVETRAAFRATIGTPNRPRALQVRISEI